jgi:hypothetical protein
MLTILLRALAPTSLSVLMVAALALPAFAEERINKDSQDIAIKGYDAVAYFTVGRAVKGRAEFEYVWQDARWWFVKADHRDMFARDPERYAPRFGGFCTGGLSLGYMIRADPENWSIIDGRLYMNHTRRGRDRLRANPAPIIAAAEDTWAVFGEGTRGYLGGELPLTANAGSRQQASKSSS